MKKTPSKYRNKKTVVNGIVFSSQKEARRYLELTGLQKKEKIVGLKLQEKFVLIPKIKLTSGKTQREATYIADFTYIEKGNYIVEDVKGVKTPVYKLKKKLMLHVHKIEILET